MPMLPCTHQRAAVDEDRLLEVLQHLPRGEHGAVEVGDGSSTANSSPPSRATVSDSRSVARSRAATCCSTRSPA